MIIHGQYLDWYAATFFTVAIAEGDAVTLFNRPGGSPIRVRVTAKADFDIDSRLYPPCFISIPPVEVWEAVKAQ